jgi:hypothetical protein
VAGRDRVKHEAGVVSGFEVTPQQRAVWELQTAIERVARDVYGAQIVQVPIEGFERATKRTLDDPLAGVRASLLARNVAVAQMRAYAEQARGAGRSWDDVAEALGIEATEGDEPRDEQAYRLLIEGRPLSVDEPSWFHRPKAWWTCTTCGQQIADHGPFESHPNDVEQGHAACCARRVAALARHQRGLR